MKYIIGATALLGYFACSQLYARKKYRVKELLDQLYSSVSGFKVNMKEYDAMREQGADPTYGEITYNSAQELLDFLQVTKEDVVYDLGSGVGKFVVQTYLATPARKVVGIELSPTRRSLAQKIKKELAQLDVLTDNRQLRFVQKNISKADFSDATIIYMCSTCFSHELMKELSKKFKTMQPGLRIISLKRLPRSAAFKQIKRMELPMTWSASSNIFIYELQ